MSKLRVGVIYGGRSGEHEVSVASAASVIRHLDRARYEPVPLRIEKDGRWTLMDAPPTISSASEVIEQARLEAAVAIPSGREAHLIAHPGPDALMTIDRAAAAVTNVGLDVVFPVLHGPYGEDGTIQGLLELANVPYVGAGVLGSAAGMDKGVMKTLFAARGLPITPYLVVMRRDWHDNQAGVCSNIERDLQFPVFVKPANLGSSVGISKAKSNGDLVEAMALALQFDRKIVVEAAVPDAREIECAVLGNDDPEASVAGEVVPSREFYDYEAKYLDDSSESLIPAPLSAAQADEIRRLAVEAFRAVEGAGMARVDFLLSRADGGLYVNEVNTIPGFTTISMYPKLWEASGLGYADLLDRLIALAIERHAEKQLLRTSAT